MRGRGEMVVFSNVRAQFKKDNQGGLRRKTRQYYWRW